MNLLIEGYIWALKQENLILLHVNINRLSLKYNGVLTAYVAMLKFQNQIRSYKIIMNLIFAKFYTQLLKAVDLYHKKPADQDLRFTKQ